MQSTIKRETSQTGLESDINRNNHGDECTFVKSGVQLSNDEIRGILQDDSHETYIKSILGKIREKTCNSTASWDINMFMAHVCAVCDCLFIGLMEEKFIDKLKFLFNLINYVYHHTKIFMMGYICILNW